MVVRRCVLACYLKGLRPSVSLRKGANKPPESAHCNRVLLPGSLGNLLGSFLLLSVSLVPAEELKLF